MLNGAWRLLLLPVLTLLQGLVVKRIPARVDYRANKSDAAVVFVHGFSGNAEATWGRFVNILLDDVSIAAWDVFGFGYPSSLRMDVPGVWTADPGIEVLSRELITALSLPPFGQYKCLAIVAHSMGGLVVQRALLDDSQLTKRVSHVVMFGTPSRGLGKASLFAIAKRQARDMTTGSAFISSLRDDWRERYGSNPPFRLRAVAGDRDEFVPSRSSLNAFPDASRAVIPGNHLSIVKPDGPDHLGLKLLVNELQGKPKGVRTPIDGARLAVEIGEFRETAEVLLPKVDGLDDDALGTLALALEGLDRRDEALEILQRRYRDGRGIGSSDALGILAGRVKRRWLVERAMADWQDAREMYETGLSQAEALNDHAQGYYHAINVAFLDLMASPSTSSVPANVVQMAKRALAHCDGAKQSNWTYATKGEAWLMLENWNNAREFYAQAVALNSSSREADSMYLQAVRVAERVFGKSGVAGIERLFDVDGNN